MAGRGRARMRSIMLAGDVMTGRGIDQILEHPSDPQLYENFVKDARQYVQLAEAENGGVGKPSTDEYVWGDALAELDAFKPDVRLINLETSITADGTPWPGKGIHYRMHPKNIGCLKEAHIDICTLANNHVLDWGYSGLEETIDTLTSAGLLSPGAGRDSASAAAPAVIDLSENKRLLVYSYAHDSSGVPRSWAAGEKKAGVNLIPDLSNSTVERVCSEIHGARVPGDIVVLSIHWGGNWGYSIPAEHVAFAHAIVENAGVDVVHGHSSHHFLPFELYKGKLILYGCGDLINDYEGIGGHEEYRSELSLAYVPQLEDDGTFAELTMLPFKMMRFSLHRASLADARWIARTLNRKGLQFGTDVDVDSGGHLHSTLTAAR